MEKKNTNPIVSIIGYFKSNPIVLLLLIASIIVSFTTDNFFAWGNFGNLVSNTVSRPVWQGSSASAVIMPTVSSKPSRK